MGPCKWKGNLTDGAGCRYRSGIFTTAEVFNFTYLVKLLASRRTARSHVYMWGHGTTRSHVPVMTWDNKEPCTCDDMGQQGAMYMWGHGTTMSHVHVRAWDNKEPCTCEDMGQQGAMYTWGHGTKRAMYKPDGLGTWDHVRTSGKQWTEESVNLDVNVLTKYYVAMPILYV